MSNRSLVICDKEEAYATAFANYLTKIKTFPLQVKVCTDLGQVEDMLEKQEIYLLLIHEKYQGRDLENLDVKRQILLVERETDKDRDGIRCLYKYQSADALLAEVLEACAGEKGVFVQPGSRSGYGKTKEVIGVFSPVHRCGKTRYALKLGKELAHSGKVLYVGMECYGGLEGYFKEGSLSVADALYHVRQENQNLGSLLSVTVESMEGLDFLPPAKMSEDMRNISSRDWIELIRQIVESGIYETVILDMDDGISGLYDILRNCTQIHLLYVKEEVALGKVRQFEGELQTMGYDDVRRKLIKKEQSL